MGKIGAMIGLMQNSEFQDPVAEDEKRAPSSGSQKRSRDEGRMGAQFNADKEEHAEISLRASQSKLNMAESSPKTKAVKANRPHKPPDPSDSDSERSIRDGHQS